jgi:Bacterial PH domain
VPQLLAGESLVLPPARPSPGALGQAFGLVAAGTAVALGFLRQAGLSPATASGRAAGGLVIGLGAAFLIRFWLGWRGAALTITDRRVILESGRVAINVPIASITTVSAVRSLPGSVLDYGTIRLDLAGGRAIVCAGLRHPKMLVDQVHVLSEQARRPE